MKTRLQVETERDLHSDTHDFVIRVKMPRSALEALTSFERQMIVQVIKSTRSTNAAILAYIADFIARLDGEGEEAPYTGGRILVDETLVGGRALDLGDEKEKL